MQIPGGYLADRFGPGKTLFIASFVMALAPLVFIGGNNFSAALSSRLIAGASGGAVFPSCVRLVSSWFPKNELSRAMGYFGSANGVGQVLSSFFLPLLILGINWRPPLLFTFLFSFFTFALTFFPARWTKKRTAEDQSRLSVRGIFTRNMFALMLPNFASLAVIYGIFAWTPVFLTENFHISNSYAGAIVAVVGLATIAGSYLGGISDRLLGSRKTIAASMLLLVPFVLLLPEANSLILAAICLLGVGFGANLYFASDFSLIPYASTQGIQTAGATFGVFNTLSNLGSVISPFLFGLVLDLTGNFTLGYSSLAVFAVLGIVGSAFISLSSLCY